MNKILSFISNLWSNLDPIVEFAAYSVIAYILSKLVEITFMQAIIIVFVFWFLNLIRVYIEFRIRK